MGGRVLVRELPLPYESRVCERERQYQRSIEQLPAAGVIGLLQDNRV